MSEWNLHGFDVLWMSPASDRGSSIGRTGPEVDLQRLETGRRTHKHGRSDGQTLAGLCRVLCGQTLQRSLGN